MRCTRTRTEGERLVRVSDATCALSAPTTLAPSAHGPVRVQPLLTRFSPPCLSFHPLPPPTAVSSPVSFVARSAERPALEDDGRAVDGAGHDDGWHHHGGTLHDHAGLRVVARLRAVTGLRVPGLTVHRLTVVRHGEREGSRGRTRVGNKCGRARVARDDRGGRLSCVGARWEWTWLWTAVTEWVELLSPSHLSGSALPLLLC